MSESEYNSESIGADQTTYMEETEVDPTTYGTEPFESTQGRIEDRVKESQAPVKIKTRDLFFTTTTSIAKMAQHSPNGHIIKIEGNADEMFGGKDDDNGKESGVFTINIGEKTQGSQKGSTSGSKIGSNMSQYKIVKIESIMVNNKFPIAFKIDVEGIKCAQPLTFSHTGEQAADIVSAERSSDRVKTLMDIKEIPSTIPEFEGFTADTIERDIVTHTLKKERVENNEKIKEKITEMYAPKNHPVAICCNKWREQTGEKPYPVEKEKGVKLDPEKAKIIIEGIKSNMGQAMQTNLGDLQIKIRPLGSDIPKVVAVEEKKAEPIRSSFKIASKNFSQSAPKQESIQSSSSTKNMWNSIGQKLFSGFNPTMRRSPSTKASLEETDYTLDYVIRVHYV